MTHQSAGQIPVIEALFTLDPKEPQRSGTPFTSCGTTFFPQTISCSNPGCREKKVGPCHLSRRGKIWAYAVQYYPPPPPFKVPDPFVPCGIGHIELPEKMRVLGMLTEADPKKLKIGMEVELVLEKMYEENGKEVVTWKFRPV
jgi:uncharacterized OB-fold protein